MDRSIKQRFLDEADAINSYVEYIEKNFYNSSCSVVRTQGYEELRILNNYVFFSTKESDSRKNGQIVRQLIDVINRRIDSIQEIRSVSEKKSLPKLSDRIKQNNLKESLCDFVRGHVVDCMDNPDKLPYHKLIEMVRPEEIKEMVDIADKAAPYTCYHMLDITDYRNILRYMRIKLYNEYIDELKGEYEDYNGLKILYSIFENKNPINIYRQAFVLLITAFDAAIFDFIYDYLKSDFFEAAKHINYDKKFTIGDITKYSDFDQFSLKTIETMLSGKYVSDIIEILYSYKKELFIINDTDCYKTLLEMIQRRNVHIHNKGIIDEKYFSKGNGKELGVHVDEYAIIDSSYYSSAYYCIYGFVSSLPE